MKSIFSFLAILSTACAFAPVSKHAAISGTSLNMVDLPEVVGAISSVPDVTGAMSSIFSSSAAVATEGTNEWFGVDDTRLLGVIFAVHWFILGLWLREHGDELTATDDDFFGEIDYGRRISNREFRNDP